MFPDPRDFLPIGVNAKGPAPPCGALESLLETSVFSNPVFGIPFEKPVTGQTEFTRPGVLSHISRAEAHLVLGWQVLRVIVALSATGADHFQNARIGAYAELWTRLVINALIVHVEFSSFPLRLTRTYRAWMP
jgi:hypothetical protein